MTRARLRSCPLAALALVACGSRTALDLGLPAADADTDVRTPPRDAGHDGVEREPESGPPDASPPPGDAGEEVILYVPAQGQTWTWTGTTWASLGDGSEAEPPARNYSAMAGDGREVVLFGGAVGESSTELGDTWVFAGGAWAQAKPASSPSPRGVPSMAGQGSTVVLFGGNSANGPVNGMNDTWIWDGTTWTLAHPPGSPSPRTLASFTTFGDVAILYGGSDTNNDALGDTWSWDGTTWTELTPPTSPPPQAGPASVTLGHRIYLFAVVFDMASFAYVTDTWAFDGTTWTEISAMGPVPPGLSAFGASALGSKALLYGGYYTGEDFIEMNEDDTLTWDGATWADLGTFTGPDMFSGFPACMMATVSR